MGISATTRNSLSENGEKLGPSKVRSSRVWKKSHGTHQQGTLHLDSSIAMTSAQTARGSGGQQLLSDGLMGCAFGAGVGRSVASAPACRLSTTNMAALEHKMAAVCISEARSGATERAQKRVRFNDAQLEETLKPKPGASALPSSYSFGSTLLPALEARPEEKPASHGSSYGSGGQRSIRDRLHGQSSSRVLPVETLDASMTNVTGSLRYLVANGQHKQHDSSVSALVAQNAELRRDAARGQAPAHSQAMRRHSDAELGAGKGIEKRLENGRALHGVDVSPLNSGGPKQACHSWQERSVGASQPPFGVSPSENSERPTMKGNEFKTGLGEKMLSRLSPRASCAQEAPSTFGAYSHQTLGGKCSEEAKPAMEMNEKMKPMQQPSCCQHHQPKGLPPARPARQPRSGRRRILSQGKQQPASLALCLQSACWPRGSIRHEPPVHMRLLKTDKYLTSPLGSGLLRLLARRLFVSPARARELQGRGAKCRLGLRLALNRQVWHGLLAVIGVGWLQPSSKRPLARQTPCTHPVTQEGGI